MSIVHTFDPDALTDMLKVGAGVAVGFTVHWFWLRAREAEVAWGMGLIARFRDGNDEWERQHQAEFAAAELPPPTELPALSAESHEDEQATEENDDHRGWWQMLVGTLVRLFKATYERLADAVGEMRRSWQTRDEVGNGDGIASVLAASGYDVRTDADIAAEIAELTGETMREAEQIEVAAIIDAHRRKTLYLPTGAHPMVTLTGAKPGRHRAAEAEDAEPVEAVA